MSYAAKAYQQSRPMVTQGASAGMGQRNQYDTITIATSHQRQGRKDKQVHFHGPGFEYSQHSTRDILLHRLLELTLSDAAPTRHSADASQSELDRGGRCAG